MKLNTHDLEFILKQIKIAEAHSAGADLTDLVNNPLVPYGLRTVDGSLNNIVPGREWIGSSDQIMPRLLDPVFIDGETAPAGLHGPTSPAGTTPTNYAQTSGNVYDSQPRLISNLISDQTIGNPATIISALTNSGHEDPFAFLNVPGNLAAYQAAVAAYEACEVAEKALAQSIANVALAQRGVGTAQGQVGQAQAALAQAQAENADTVPAQAALATAQSNLAAAQNGLLAAQGAQNAATAALAPVVAAKTVAYAAMTATLGVTMEGDTVVIPNVAADLGDTAPFNGFFTLFGQFFDHGLDLASKGGSGTVYIPLQPDDPLYVAGSPTNFMVLTRAQNQPGTDGVLGTADDVHEHKNETTPWIDLNQVYTSNPSHQVFLREYAMVNEKPVATGRMLEGASGGPPTWADVKLQAEQKLGILLNDVDVLRVPAVLTDLYGQFIPGENGLPQLVSGSGSGFMTGDLETPVAASQAMSAGRAFLNDIAHTAVPSAALVDHDRNPMTEAVAVTPDADNVAGNAITPNMFGISTTYDDELLDAHFIVGDGRGNENIGLTSVHHLFHHEHNLRIEQIKTELFSADDASAPFLNEWLLTDLTESEFNVAKAQMLALKNAPTPDEQAIDTFLAGFAWDGERLFQAGRFSTEMVYQHLVFEEFARGVAPDVDPFLFSNTTSINGAIVAEFAHVVYRFGHSMLTDTIDIIKVDGQGNPVESEVGLIEAFLNPIAFNAAGASAEDAAAAILRGMTRQVGNEIDEHITDALRNNLVGLPLDLGTINIARARETGVPSMNEARRQFYEDSHDSRVKPYESWFDFALAMKNPASLINFIAAYGTHETILQATSLDAKRAAATLLVMGGTNAPEDRLDFLNGGGDWVNGTNGKTTTGLDDVDFWIGGLAEKKMTFGSMLGSSFTYVFEFQMEQLQAGDRFYYLSRTQGLNLLNELEADSFAQLIMRNTSVGEDGTPHINGAAFQTADYILEIDQSKQITGLGTAGRDDPTHTNPVLQAISPMVIRDDPTTTAVETNYLRYTGLDHVVLGGTAGADTLIGGEGDDTLWGGAGNDRLEGGYGVDHLHGGAGDDIITDSGTDIGAADVIHGDDGNDVITPGNGLDLIFGGRGSDFIYGGTEAKTVSGGEGNDFIRGGTGISMLVGNEGDDWIEGGESFDTLAGENSELFFNSTIIGHDVLNGRGNDNDYDAESGDDIMFQGEGIERNNGMAGFDWAIHKGNDQAADSDMTVSIFQNQQNNILRDRFDLVEGLSGWKHDDKLVGREVVVGAYDANGNATEIDPDAPLDSYSNALLQKNVGLIEGLDRLVAHLARTEVTVAGKTELIVMDTADASDIILGGGGSDLIEGKAGNDIIDGDAWLNVRIVIKDTNGTEIASVDSLADVVTSLVRPDLNGRTLPELMLAGAINPIQLSIVREILDGSQTGHIDTAVFWDVSDNYTFVRNADDSITVEHVDVSDAVDPVSGRNRASDGIDRLFNIEQLRFADGTFDADQLVNSPASGVAIISDVTPTEGQTLTVDVSTITDANGGIASGFSYQWQSSTDGTTWNNVAALLGGTNPVFTPVDVNIPLLGNFSDTLAGQQLRVVVSFTDGAGNAESVISAATGPVGANWARGLLTGGTFNGTAGDDIANGSGAAETLNGNAGNDILNGAGGGDTINGGSGDDTINGAAGNDAIRQASTDGRDRIDGGAGTDTYTLFGVAGAETFRLYAVAGNQNPGLAASLGTSFAAATEIVVTRTVGGVESVIAELDNIEEIVIDSLNVTANDNGGLNTAPSGGDTIQVFGNFNATSLNFSTITINGTAGNDTVDIAALASAHRIVFRSNGGDDTVIGVLRSQDVIELPAGSDPVSYVRNFDAGTGLSTLTNGTHRVTFSGDFDPTLAVTAPPQPSRGAFTLTQRDLDGLARLIDGERPFDGDDDADHALGVRDIAGGGNNQGNPTYGSADETFIRLTQARYGDYDEAIDNRALNPIFDGLDPRAISDILGAQEAGLPKAGNDANIFLMTFGQYFDHGLSFIPKTAGNGAVQIGAPGNGAPGSGNPADLTRGEVVGFDEDGVPLHRNTTTAYVDQNQAYGSHVLVTQLLRQGDGNGGLTALLLKGADDPSAEGQSLLPTLREAIQHHWANNTLFTLEDGSQIAFRSYWSAYPVSEGVTGDLIGADGAFDPQVLSMFVTDFMGSGQPLLLDTNPYINVLDHYLAGDGRVNENFGLTAMHTVWARNHNFHVENLRAAGFEGSEQEIFEAAKVINEAEYQRVVFQEYAEALIGGIRGDGDHGHDGYNPDADPGISHEFAAAVYRFGHSLIGQTLTVLDENGQPTQVALFDAFLNPSNASGVFTLPVQQLNQYGYFPQPGYAQFGVDAILGGQVLQPAEAVDFNIVDAVRNDLVRIQADLFAFNVARGRDVGLGTLNQVRADLAASNNTYVEEAVGFAGDMSPYTSWEDFQARNGLSDAVIAQFRQAYPDLVLDTQAEIDAFTAVNPDIALVGGNTVKGIDRVDLWVGGLAEKHINDGMVGQTFWVVLHEQFDRLQEADRFYYKDRLEAFDFYDAFIDGQEFSDIVARNTGLTGLDEHIFEVNDEDDDGQGQGDDDDEDEDDDDGVGNGDNEDEDEDDTAGSGDDDDDDDDDQNDDCGCDDDDDETGTPAPAPSGGATRVGTPNSDTLLGTIAADNLIGLAGDDVLIGDSGDDAISAGDGADFVDGGAGRDTIQAGAGDDTVFAGADADLIHGEAGADRIFGQGGNDVILAGAGDDTVVGGDGSDLFVGEVGDGNDVYFGDEIDGGTGIDTLDLSAITANLTVDLGNGLLGRGSAFSSQSGTDTLWSIENVATGSGNDTITASAAVNVIEGGAGNDTFRFLDAASADGDTILDFEPGDRLDLSGIDANATANGNQAFTLVAGPDFTASGQLMVTYEMREDVAYTVVQGNVGGGAEAEFRIDLKGSHNLTGTNFIL